MLLIKHLSQSALWSGDIQVSPIMPRSCSGCWSGNWFIKIIFHQLITISGITRIFSIKIYHPIGWQWYLLIKQLVNADGNLLTYNEFLSEFRSPVMQFFDALLRAVLQYLRCSIIKVSMIDQNIWWVWAGCFQSDPLIFIYLKTLSCVLLSS